MIWLKVFDSAVIDAVFLSHSRSRAQPKSIDGDAKWEDVMWSIFMDKAYELTLTVMSGSVVIGSLVVHPEDLAVVPVDRLGLTDVSLN